MSFCVSDCLSVCHQSLTSEAPFVVENNRPAATWPDRGAIEFRSVDVRYRDGLPLVLKSVSLNIKSQEKIGIVGRTGSGILFPVNLLDC